MRYYDSDKLLDIFLKILINLHIKIIIHKL